MKSWRKEVEAIAFDEGLRQLEWRIMGSTHQQLLGVITAKGSRVVPIAITCSASPSDWRAAHRVRSDIRRAIRAAHQLEG